MSLKKIVLAFTALVFLAGTAAKADDINFYCGTNNAGACTGTVVTEPGGNYKLAGSNVFDFDGTYTSNVPFVFSFDTFTGVANITGTGVDLGQNFSGVISNVVLQKGKVYSNLGFEVDWPTVPHDAQVTLGSPTGFDFVGIEINDKGQTLRQGKIDITPSPIPEPGSFMLLGTGLLAIVGILRRKQRVN